MIPVSAPRVTDQVIGKTGLTTHPNMTSLPVSTPHATGQLAAHTVSNPDLHMLIGVSAQRTSAQDDTNRKMPPLTTTDRSEELIQTSVSTPQAEPHCLALQELLHYQPTQNHRT